MVRQLLLPLLGLGLLLAAETATAQTQMAAANSPASAAKTARQTRRAAGRTLTARERRQAEAAAQAAAKNQVVAMNTTTAPGWSGWSNDPVALPDDGTLYHPRTNLSVAPGMPLNQISHGVTTDYDGRPLRRPGTSNSTLPTQR